MQPKPIAQHYIPLLNKAAYDPEDTFTEPFYEFTERFNSLARYWSLGQAQYSMLTDDLEHLQTEVDGAVWEHDSVSVDVDLYAFPQNLRLSTLSMCFALVEELLRQLSREIAPQKAIAENNGPQPDLSIANRYILLLTHQQGALPGVASAPVEEHATEQVRLGMAQALEQIGTTILADLTQVKAQLAHDARTGKELSDTDVESTLDHIGKLVKSCEKVYLAFLAKESA